AGRFVVAWGEQDLPDNRVELRRFFVEPGEVPPTAFAGDVLVAQTALGVLMGNVNMASDGAFVVSYADQSDPNSARALEFTRTGAVLTGGPATPSDTTSNNIDAGVGLREYLLAWQEPGVSTDIRGRRYVRRAVFSDDFETGGSEGWSGVAP
ncbi:MAG: hypothetical protein KBA72_16895, partial [Thermoanaerobaculia bacterium]|nr:hypothetical protein [Thermoanaerobaculia bacterium]